ncbi:glycosyltransferase family 2 protein [Seonamhaeicola maritimus]|uniref:glycosyltransferase family 2 protein n=1 Tax=Seonamhaeicola maritimus TaxID=2591822 RepID=UPI0024941B24|nr:glycosyltransferase family 2 protein [Seonamhaeicola maritimus]
MLSVITVNYNNKEGLKRTIKSVRSQSYRKFEYLIIDGGSNDGSLDVINSFKNDIDYFESKKDNGIYNAMNKGIEQAKGDYLLFLNSGDYLYSKDALLYFKQAFLSMPHKDLYYGKIKLISNKEWIKDYPKKLSFFYFVKDSLPHPATFIKRSCFDILQYDESLKIVSDWKFFLVGICKFNFSYHYIDHVIASFVMDGISSINSDLVDEERNCVLMDEFSHFMHDYSKFKKQEQELTRLEQANIIERLLKRIYRKIVK